MRSFCTYLPFLCLIATLSVAQIGSGANDSDAVFNDLTKKYLADRRYANVEGSPFLLPDWSVGGLLPKAGKKFEALRMKLDLVSQQLIYLNGQNQEMTPPAERVKEFDLTSDGKKMFFKTGYPPIEHQTTNSFYQEVLADTVSLLKFSQKEIVQRDEFDKKKTFILYEDFYIYYNEAITPLRNKNSLSKVFPDISKEIVSYISDNKLKVKNEGDMINLVKFVNSKLQ